MWDIKGCKRLVVSTWIKSSVKDESKTEGWISKKHKCLSWVSFTTIIKSTRLCIQVRSKMSCSQNTHVPARRRSAPHLLDVCKILQSLTRFGNLTGNESDFSRSAGVDSRTVKAQIHSTLKLKTTIYLQYRTINGRSLSQDFKGYRPPDVKMMSLDYFLIRPE